MNWELQILCLNKLFLTKIFSGAIQGCLSDAAHQQNPGKTFEGGKPVKYSDSWTGRMISEKCP